MHIAYSSKSWKTLHKQIKNGKYKFEKRANNGKVAFSPLGRVFSGHRLYVEPRR